MWTTGRVLSGLSRVPLARGILVNNGVTAPASRGRPAWSSKTPKEEKEKEEDEDKPIKFSTSKGSYKTWKVEHSLGSQHQRPLSTVVLVSLVGIGLLLWCVFRKETEIDRKLEVELYQHLPGLLPEEEDEEEEEEEKPS